MNRRLSLILIVLVWSQPLVGQTPSLPVSTPEAVGLSTETLGGVAERVGQLPEARALLIARHGALVLEQYYREMGPDSAWNVKSVTKSVQSALAGLAVQDGKLDLDQRVSEILASRFRAMSDGDISWGPWLTRSDSLRREITVRDLVTMRPGFMGTDLDDTYVGMLAHAPDQVRFALEVPLEASPGERFRYNTASAMLLNGIIREVTGQSPRDYAQQRLFGPLGTRINRWFTDQTGLETGGSELYLTARDMMAIGVLYLARGEFAGQRILSPEWVEASLAVQVRFANPPDDPAAQLLPDASGYGFMWWHRRSGDRDMVCAWGYGGQLICLVPSLDLAVVTLSTINLNAQYHVNLFAELDRGLLGGLTP